MGGEILELVGDHSPADSPRVLGIESGSLRLSPVTRQDPARGVLRGVRGTAMAVCSTALAVAAHAAGGGGWPDLGLAALVLVLLATAGASLARRRRGFPGILGVLAVTQVQLHFLLALADHHAGPGQSMFWPGWRMLAAHAVAVLLTALVLTKAEAAVFAVAAALARLLPQPLPLLRAESPCDPLTVTERVDRLLRVLFRSVCPRRGPPACC